MINLWAKFMVFLEMVKIGHNQVCWLLGVSSHRREILEKEESNVKREVAFTKAKKHGIH